MTTPAATAAAPRTASGAQAQPAPVVTSPFRAGTFRTLSSDGYRVTANLAATATPLSNYTPSPNSYIRGLWIQVQGVTAGNAAAVAFAGDAPGNVIQSLTFQDANQKPIVGPLDGYKMLQVVNKFGGYHQLGDPRASAIYSVTTGNVATGGSFVYVMYVPLEVVARDALGALQNKSASSSFQLVLTLNTIANVYTTAPTNPAAVTVTIYEDGWVQPKATDATGQPLAQAPPQLGTTQYWTQGTYDGLNGSVQTQLTQGLGYPIRMLAAVNYDAGNSSRATGDTDWPDPTQFLLRGTSIWNVGKLAWKDQMSRLYRYNSVTADSANGLENGVYVLPFHDDFTLAPGAELRNAYLATQQGDQFQILGTFNGNSNLYWVANYVAPAAGANNVASLRGR